MNHGDDSSIRLKEIAVKDYGIFLEKVLLQNFRFLEQIALSVTIYNYLEEEDATKM